MKHIHCYKTEPRDNKWGHYIWKGEIKTKKANLDQNYAHYVSPLKCFNDITLSWGILVLPSITYMSLTSDPLYLLFILTLSRKKFKHFFELLSLNWQLPSPC